jgi:tRNA (guanosine-2'-O-)-methyltransferase
VVAFAPQVGRVGSLNVTAAAAIGCYEVRRQGWDPKDDEEPPMLDDEASDADLT